MSATPAAFPCVFDAVAPVRSAADGLARAFCFSLLTALSAQISISLPWTPVPVTGQTFAVLLSGALLGRRWGAASVALYLLEGCSGLPFFAGGGAGLARLLGPTGGYLLAFIPAAWVTGYLTERGWGRSPFSAAGMMAIGSAVVFFFGLLGLARFVPPHRLLALGLYPFLLGDLAKTCLSAALLPLGWRALGMPRGSR